MRNGQAKDVGTLYYIESEGGNAVKVGFASNVASRLSGLQTGSPHKLKVRWEQKATREAEIAVHQYLKPFRISREWYPDDGLTCMVADMLGYELLDHAETDCLTNGTDYAAAVDAAVITLADVRRVLPDVVKEHAAWIAAGRPNEDEPDALALA